MLVKLNGIGARIVLVRTFKHLSPSPGRIELNLNAQLVCPWHLKLKLKILLILMKQFLK